MKTIPPEIVYALIALAFLLFQYLVKRFGPQVLQEPPSDEQLAQNPEEVTDVPVVFAGSGVADDIFGHSGAYRVAPVRQRFSRSSPMGSRRALRNGVVYATILGPCRASEPHDIRQ